MSENLPATPSQSEPQDNSTATRRAKRQKRMQTVLQVLGIPGGIGLAPTIVFLRQGEWLLAAVMGAASFGVIVLAVFAKFFSDLGNKVLDRIEERLEETTDPFAAWIVAQLEAAVVRCWWQITPQFRGAYYQSLIYEYRTYRTKGLKTPGDFSPDLDKVFVPLRVTAKSLEQISPTLIQRQETAGSLEIWDFLAESQHEPAYRRLVIIGAPGSGKTTLLNHIALTYAHNTHRRRSRQVPTLVPVLLPLHKIRAEITATPPKPLTAVIVEQVKTLPKGSSLNLSPQWFESKLQHGQCLVMLDGLDEVADEAQRRQVSQWVDAQMRAYPEARWILTSRPYGYRNAQLAEARSTLAVQSFSLSQMELFLRRWYLQNEILRQVRQRDPGVEKAAENKAHDLIGRIKNYPPLAAMALNPLLLTMIATVHDNRGALPGSRVDLYDEICDVLLVRRQEAKGLTEPFPLKPEQKKSVLQVLALELMVQEKREFPLEQGLALMTEPLYHVAGKTVTPAEFIAHIQHVSGLLQEREVEVYQFAHLSFQEYLASAQIKETGRTDVLTQNIQRTWWHETIRLFAARNDTTALVEAALQQPTVATLTIAYDCLEEGKSLHPETRRRLEEMSLDATDPTVAKLAAEVKLARRLTHLLRMDEAVQIDAGYLTQAEFQVFIADQAATNSREPAQAPAQPALDLSLEAALEFCAWLSTWESANLVSQSDAGSGLYSFYRLPTQLELNRVPLAPENQPLPAWTLGCRSLGQRGLRLVKQQLPPEFYPLYRALFALDWEKADQATTELLRQPASSQQLQRSASQGIETLPCSRLQILDQLWMHYSTGRQGLGMQASLWEMTPGQGAERQQRFSHRVGWQPTPASAALAPTPLPGYYPRQSFSEELLRKATACGLERGLALTTFAVVKVNAQGEEVQRAWQQAHGFGEDLGKGVGLEMLAIPGGTFVMGSPEEEERHLDRESPQHQVTVPSFFMGQYLVTQAQWRQVAALPRVHRRLQPNPSGFKGDTRPVERVSWHESVEFCQRLSNHTGRDYRLPSEAEWEYACRAGTTTPFHFGETITTELANYRGQDWEYEGKTYPGNYGSGPYGVFREETTEVGSFPANAFGLFDLHGNVWEWCLDYWHENYEGAPKDGQPWFDPNISPVM